MSPPVQLGQPRADNPQVLPVGGARGDGESGPKRPTQCSPPSGVLAAPRHGTSGTTRSSHLRRPLQGARRLTTPLAAPAATEEKHSPTEVPRPRVHSPRTPRAPPVPTEQGGEPVAGSGWKGRSGPILANHALWATPPHPQLEGRVPTRRPRGKEGSPAASRLSGRWPVPGVCSPSLPDTPHWGTAGAHRAQWVLGSCFSSGH